MDNITGADLLNALNDLNQELPKAVKLMGKYGRDFAKSQRDYKAAVAEETIRLKTGGVAATLIRDTIYASDKVLNSMYERDKSEVLYKTSQEHINALKTEIRVLEELIDKEWAQ